MISTETINFELRGRFEDATELGKKYFSVRYESGPRIVRIGACITEYTWDNRLATIDRLLAFEADHADEFAVEFDVVPLAAVNDENFAEA